MEIERLWYQNHPLTYVLLPLAWLYCTVMWLRRLAYRSRVLAATRLRVPVIVVGNISVGGTGKTPLVVCLAQMLRDAGHAPGIVSRGYGGAADRWPQVVRADSDPFAVGDEPVLIAKRSGCPVVVAPDRVAAACMLLDRNTCDVIIADDGLQHYRLARDIEIAVVDGERRYGNGHCLPAGPLREPMGRLRSVDLVIANGEAQDEPFVMRLAVRRVINLSDRSHATQLGAFAGKEVHAVAGIGNPKRFFDLLRGAGLVVLEHRYPDHHRFQLQDLDFADSRPLLMTEKDAVKCQRFAASALRNAWYVSVQAQPDAQFVSRLLALLEEKIRG